MVHIAILSYYDRLEYSTTHVCVLSLNVMYVALRTTMHELCVLCAAELILRQRHARSQPEAALATRTRGVASFERSIRDMSDSRSAAST